MSQVGQDNAIDTKNNTLIGAMQNMLDKVKGPVFWFAAGYVLCKVMDRKKVKVIKA